MRRLSALPGLRASSAREGVAPESTAGPAHTRATTTPWSVRKSLKGFASEDGQPGRATMPRKAATRVRAARQDIRPGGGPGSAYRLLARNPEPSAGLRRAGPAGLLRLLGRRLALGRG